MTGDKFIGEDIAFFRKCKKINIPLHAHTGAVAKHVKRMAWDTDYYGLLWNSLNTEENKNTPPN
jgi:hypothetical protein